MNVIKILKVMCILSRFHGSLIRVLREGAMEVFTPGHALLRTGDNFQRNGVK